MSNFLALGPGLYPSHWESHYSRSFKLINGEQGHQGSHNAWESPACLLTPGSLCVLASSIPPGWAHCRPSPLFVPLWVPSRPCSHTSPCQAFLSFQICRPILRRVATILGWWKLKAIFAKRDTWTILRALVSQQLAQRPALLGRAVHPAVRVALPQLLGFAAAAV